MPGVLHKLHATLFKSVKKCLSAKLWQDQGWGCTANLRSGSGSRFGAARSCEVGCGKPARLVIFQGEPRLCSVSARALQIGDLCKSRHGRIAGAASALPQAGLGSVGLGITFLISLCKQRASNVAEAQQRLRTASWSACVWGDHVFASTGFSSTGFAFAACCIQACV